MAFSSNSELVDTLERRASPVALVGEVPLMPSVVVERESRRRSLRVAEVMALGNTGVPAVELLRWNIWDKAAVVIEPRRLVCISAGGGEGGLLAVLLSFVLSKGMVKMGELRRSRERWFYINES